MNPLRIEIGPGEVLVVDTGIQLSLVLTDGTQHRQFATTRLSPREAVAFGVAIERAVVELLGQSEAVKVLEDVLQVPAGVDVRRELYGDDE